MTHLRIWLVVGALLAGIAALAADPAYYLRKETWQETLLSSREALVRFEAEKEQRRKASGAPLGGIELGTWYAIGPFSSKREKAFADVFPPEDEIDLAKAYEGGKLRWAKHPEWTDGLVHDLHGGSQCATYLTRTLTVAAARTVTGYFGSDDGLTVWLNGKKLLANDVPRGPAPNQDKVPLALRAGENRLLMKVNNLTGGYGFYFSLDPEPGERDPKTEARKGLWPLLQRDFADPAALRRMRYEQKDQIWAEDWPAGDSAALAKRYADATRIPFLHDEADRLLAGAGSTAGLAAVRAVYARSRDTEEAVAALRAFDPAPLRRAIEDLSRSYAARYPNGKRFLSRLANLEQRRQAALAGADRAERPALEACAPLAGEVEHLRREALLANPLLDFDRLLVVKRRADRLGLPQNWQGNSSIARTGYDNEIAVLSPVAPDGRLQTLYRPEGGRFAGDLDLHFDGDRLLFSLPAANNRWQVFEIGVDGKGLRQVTPGDQPDVDNFDACYLPNGKVIFCSTACFEGVPCVGGGDHVALLYLLDPATGKVRQLTFDQDHNWCPTLLNDGRVLYTRWEYSDTPHYFTRILFQMNPDGTEQMEYYGSNSYWPNSVFYARPIPGDPTKIAGIVSGHHGVPRMGEMVLFDRGKGRREGEGILQRIPGYGQKVDPLIRDTLVDATWPKFLHPYPLSAKYFLVSCKPDAESPWGIYLADVFDNLLPVQVLEGYALFEPTPVRRRPAPPAVPERVNLARRDATISLSDIYAGGAMKGVPRGSVKALRVFANHYAYPGMGGHINIGIDGPWDAKRILGTVPVHEDGSAMFKAPANTPLVIQPLDAEGKALQVMRSWMTAMPGETLSCVGCHEPLNATPPKRLTLASRQGPTEIRPWYGPARGFSFEREVQPVLDRSCVSCHGGKAGGAAPDLRGKKARPEYSGGFTPAYEALHPFVRRPGPESDYHMPIAAEYHADTSELVQMLRKSHHGVTLGAESWDRLVTWIDLNVPCHGTWGEHRAIPGQGRQRRQALRLLYTGMDEDPESIAETPPALQARTEPPAPKVIPLKAQTPVGPATSAAGRLDPSVEATGRASGSKFENRKSKIVLDLVDIRSGEFVMGDAAGCPDEQPAAPVRIGRPFRMGRCEVTNEQYRLFDPAHDSRYASHLNKDQTQRGYPLNEAKQPVARVSWEQAMAFCRWLSKKTGLRFSLPTEAQWEYACRAGTTTPLSYGGEDTDFSPFANLADASLSRWSRRDSPDWFPKDARFTDRALVSSPVGTYQPNAWGLCDMHGNAAEWTRTTYAPYPYRADDGRDDGTSAGRKVVRGGSWFDRPKRCRSAFRLSYPAWQGVYNVGFRVVCEE